MKQAFVNRTHPLNTDSVDSVFRFIIENTNDVYFVLDKSNKCIYASPSLKTNFGYTIQEVNEMTLSDIIHPDDLKRSELLLDSYLKKNNDQIKAEYRVKTKSGKYIWTENIFRRVPESIYSLVSSRDITLRKETENQSSENEEKLRRIFDASPEAIFITNSDLKIIDCSSEAQNLLGISRKEILNLYIYDLIENLDKIQAEAFIGKGKEIEQLKFMEFYLTKQNREIVNVMVSGSFIPDENGNIKKYVFIIQNISHFKHIEAELLKSKEKAEGADKLKSAFLANMSHEIRTPMNSIIGFSDLLADPSLKKQEIVFYTSIIKDRCNNLLRIVNDILDISKIEARQVELVESEFSVNKLLEDLYLNYAQKLINENKFQVVLNLTKENEDNDLEIIADELRLKQVLSNLLDNAIKFTKVGEIEFGAKLTDDQRILFYVRDTGIGIHPDKHQMIFERFRQIDESLDREYGGNGLGLAICKAFVELMGGGISLISEPGKGSTFSFTIKYKNKNTNKIKIKTETELTQLKWKGKRILVVEDDKGSLLFMKSLFNLTEAQIVIVQSGKEAIELFMNDNNFDLVLMDIQLPDINGLEVTRMIKGINKDIPVIAQTAYAMQGDNEKCLKAGCDDYISKPIDISELFTKINRFLEQKE